MTQQDIYILGIETSCDETAAAVAANGKQVVSSVVASQIKLHEKYGGVVPEIASRAHVENILPVISEAIDAARITPEQIDAVAVANQPGLTIALMVGVTAAKTLAFGWGKPLVAVNHVHAHLQSALLEAESIELPAVALIVSGGHTNLYDAESAIDLRLIGRTIDDAAGEAFDKVAKLLHLPYPGGVHISNAALSGDPNAIKFPRAWLEKESLDFSFSGLKTSVMNHCNRQMQQKKDLQIQDICASFQEAVVDVLMEKTVLATKKYGINTVVLGGGVSSNRRFREKLKKRCRAENIAFFVPRPAYCTDNGAMIALAGHYKFAECGETSLEQDVYSRSQLA